MCVCMYVRVSKILVVLNEPLNNSEESTAQEQLHLEEITPPQNFLRD